MNELNIVILCPKEIINKITPKIYTLYIYRKLLTNNNVNRS